MSQLMVALIQASEKAANIARSCRQEERLFSLLIEEKKNDSQKRTCAADFKTLADVLVQEVIRHDIGKQFPGLENSIFGEETNEFMNGLGEKIHVRLGDTEKDTSSLLSKVLDGNMEAAEALAFAAHQDIIIPDLHTGAVDVPLHSLGIWVDPIDSTYQYIKGISDSVPEDDIYRHGLQCVTVLIGVYDLHSGVPVMGVINQPFAVLDSIKGWTGRYFWGISDGLRSINSLTSRTDEQMKGEPIEPSAICEGLKISAVLSTRESKRVKALFQENCVAGVYYASGAGYKALCVILGLVDVYLFTKDSTYRWDSCSPHAILCSMGGGVADLKECLKKRQCGRPEEQPELVYNIPVLEASGVDKWSNKGGLIAYRSKSDLDAVIQLLSTIRMD